MVAVCGSCWRFWVAVCGFVIVCCGWCLGLLVVIWIGGWCALCDSIGDAGCGCNCYIVLLICYRLQSSMGCCVVGLLLWWLIWRVGNCVRCLRCL